MTRFFTLAIVYLVYVHQAEADYYEDFALEYQQKHPYISPNPAEPSAPTKFDPSCPDYNTGYTGCPIFDKHGKLVVFEGLPVSRKAAEEYTKNYNKKY
jgi:hypothetical protein